MGRSLKYTILLGLCRLFRLQKIMELPPEKYLTFGGDEVFAAAADSIKARLEQYGVHVTMEVAPGMYHCYAVMPFVKEAMPAYRRMIEYIKR